MDHVVVAKIASGEIPRAVDVREKVKAIARAGGKVLTRFIEKEGSLEDCYERALLHGAKNPWPKRFYVFRQRLVEPDTRVALREMPEAHRKKCVYEMRKIADAIKILLPKLD